MNFTKLIPAFMVLMLFIVGGVFAVNILASSDSAVNVTGTAFEAPSENMQKQNSMIVSFLGIVGVLLALGILIKAVSCLM